MSDNRRPVRSSAQNGQRRIILSPEERRDAVERKAGVRARRAEATAESRKRLPERKPEEKKFYHKYLDRFNMWRLGISVNLDSLLKGLVIGGLIVLFALLQTTVFSKLRPLGATPDFMLPLVIAVGIGEGERWGGVTGLAAAFIIECLGTAGVTLLPLLYVPCGFVAGILGTYFLRDSAMLRAIFSASSGVLRAIFTVILASVSFDSPDAGLLFKEVVVPEYFSTLVFSVLPHVAVWLSLRKFHKTRAERVD